MNRQVTDKRMEKGEQTRRRLLEAATGLVAEQGIPAVSAAKLAAAAGVSKSNVFHHFKSVDEILAGSLEQLFSELLVPAGEQAETLEGFLSALGDSVLWVPEEQMPLFRAFFTFYHEGMFNPAYRHTFTVYREEMTAVLHGQLARLLPGPVPEGAIRSACTLLLSMLDGIGLHVLLGGERERYEQAWALQAGMLTKLLSPES